METEKEPKFRIRIEDLKMNKHKVITIYTNTNKPINLTEFRDKLKQKVNEI